MLPIGQLAAFQFSLDTALALGSAAMTGYFWLVQARRERPKMTIYQLRSFRASLRRSQSENGGKTLGLTQIDGGGTLIANNSIRQNAIVRFDCYLPHENGEIRGRWGYVEDDKPPWNIPPESALGVSLACFFDVPDDYTIPDDLSFRVEFVAASGQRFAHYFLREAPEL